MYVTVWSEVLQNPLAAWLRKRLRFEVSGYSVEVDGAIKKKKKKVTHQRKMHASNWDLSYRAHTQTHSNYRHCKSHAQLHRNMCRNRNPFLYILFYNPKAPSHLTARTRIIEMQNVYMDITMTAIFQCIKL